MVATPAKQGDIAAHSIDNAKIGNVAIREHGIEQCPESPAGWTNGSSAQKAQAEAQGLQYEDRTAVARKAGCPGPSVAARRRDAYLNSQPRSSPAGSNIAEGGRSSHS